MAQIQVQPQDLEARAGELRGHAQRIQQAVTIVDEQILSRMNQSVFSGNRPDMLRGRYQEMHDMLLNFQQLVNNFAARLEQAATDFRAADTTN